MLERLEEALKALEDTASELYERELRERDLDGFRREVSRIITDMVLSMSDRLIRYVAEEYSRHVRTDPPYACEVLFRALRDLAKLAILHTKIIVMQKLQLASSDRNFNIRFNMDREVIDYLVSEIKPLRITFTAIDEAKLEALREVLRRLIVFTEPYKKYYTYVPGLTEHRVGMLVGMAPPHRFQHFGQYAYYIGCIPNRVYEERSRLTGKSCRPNMDAKHVFYSLVMNVLTRKNINRYYAYIMHQAYSSNLDKLAERARRGEIDRKMVRALAYRYALKETVRVFAHHFWYMFRKAHDMYVEDPYPVARLSQHPYYPPAIYDKKKRIFTSIIDGKTIPIP